ncbi:MAG: hypothetical protein ACI83Y_002466 [Candidatus Azotimanducaceae bacterium]
MDSAESGDREHVAEANDATLDHAGRDPSSLTKSGLGTVAEDLIHQVARRAVTPDGKLDLTNGESRPVGARELVEVDDDVATSLQPVELLNTEIGGSLGELAGTHDRNGSLLAGVTVAFDSNVGEERQRVMLGDRGAIRRRASECENGAIGHKIRP